jgi:hypothetical protein
MIPLQLLLIEDSEDDALLTRLELARSGYAVRMERVETSDALIACLARQTWDVVISDYTMPRLNGMAALRLVRERDADIPFIFVSGTIGEDVAVAAMKTGAQDYILKGQLKRLVPAVERELRDVAERRQRRMAEAALAHAHDWMRFTLDAAQVGTWESNLVTGQTVWSEIMQALHGAPVGEFGGTLEAFIATVHPDDALRVRELFAEAVRDHIEPRLDYRVIWPDGSIHWITGVGRTFYDEAGVPLRAAGICLDITGQKRLEEQIRQAQRLESLGRLAGGVAHDFNNLLTAMLGCCDYLLEELTAGQPSARAALYLGQIRKGAERAAGLTNQLLAFSRKQIIRPTLLNLNAVIDNLGPMLRRLTRENIEVIVRAAADLGSVRGDADQLEQVLLNLTVNARDAMIDGGTLTIETADVEIDETFVRQHQALIPGPHVRLSVSDTGSGMPPSVLSRLFEPFFTTKPLGQGAGLGLATAYGIVTQNQGTIVVESELGKGSTFTVYLPRVSDAADALPIADALSVPGGNETVLLVEDDAPVRELVGEMLSRSGYAVIETASGEEALHQAATHPGPIDIVVTDVVMPGMNGRVLADRLTARHPHLKVLFMSGYTDNAIDHNGVLDADVAFLPKPFTATNLMRAVRGALNTVTVAEAGGAVQHPD